MRKLLKRFKCYFLSVLREKYLHEGKNRKLNLFTKAVEKKTQELGLQNSNFIIPSGSTVFQHYSCTTCRDMMKIMMTAYDNDFFHGLWNHKEYVIKITGENERNERINTTVENPHFEKKYKILGGKTGTLALVGNELLICNLALLTEINGKVVCAVMMHINDTRKRFFEMENLLDYIKGETAEPKVNCASAYIVCTLGLNGESEIICEKNADVKYHSASLAKVISVLTALDYVYDLSTRIKFKKTDLHRGSGAIFKEDDVITFEDAIYAMMLCSSNQAAQAVARTVAESIKTKNRPF